MFCVSFSLITVHGLCFSGLFYLANIRNKFQVIKCRDGINHIFVWINNDPIIALHQFW
jgi:hypothetical protein